MRPRICITGPGEELPAGAPGFPSPPRPAAAPGPRVPAGVSPPTPARRGPALPVAGAAEAGGSPGASSPHLSHDTPGGHPPRKGRGTHSLRGGWGGKEGKKAAAGATGRRLRATPRPGTACAPADGASPPRKSRSPGVAVNSRCRERWQQPPGRDGEV